MPRLTRQQAINAFCRACIVDDRPGNGTWRQQTQACGSESCALWVYRPISRSNEAVQARQSVEEDKA